MNVEKSCLDCVHGFHEPEWLNVVAEKVWSMIEHGTRCNAHLSKMPDWVERPILDKNHPYINCSAYQYGENPYE